MRMGMIIVLFSFYAIMILVGLANYVLGSLSLWTLATRRRISKPWLAWIPIASSWLIGALADDYDGRRGMKRKWRAVLLTLSLLMVVLIVLMYAVLLGMIFVTAMNEGMKFIETSELAVAIAAVVMLFYFFMAIIAVVLTVCTGICLFKIFESTKPEKAVKYLLLSLMVPLAEAICLMYCRNHGYEAMVPEACLYPEDASEQKTDEI